MQKLQCSGLKPSESHLRLVILTGVYIFDEEPLFSGLDNLYDISSYNVETGSLVGYTESEIRVYFGDQISALRTKLNYENDEAVMNDVRERYNGYIFVVDTADGKISEPVYNPLAINHVFHDLDLLDQWSLSDPMKSDSGVVPTGYLHDSVIQTDTSVLMNSYKPSALSLMSHIYFTGYATIDHYNKDSSVLNLKIPKNQITFHYFLLKQ